MARVTKSVSERREEIINTAKSIFIETGFEKTQISDIAGRMNVSQGLVYHYFKSKVEMLYAVIDEIADEKQKQIDNILNSMDTSASQKLITLLKIKTESDDLDKLVPSITSDAAIIEYCSRRITLSAMPMLIALINQGNGDGSWCCKYPEETALFVSSGLRGLHEKMGSPENNKRIKIALMDIMQKILGTFQPG